MILQVFNVSVDEGDIGQRKRLTDTDIWRVTSAYKCDSTNNEVRNLDLTDGQLRVAENTVY